MDGTLIGTAFIVGLILLISAPTYRLLRKFQMPWWSYVAVLTPSLILLVLSGVSGYWYGPLAAAWIIIAAAIVLIGIAMISRRRKISP